ncbi:excalibur calcium-binding domain-containing protein [Leucobacter sp. NPDC058333]|uniref:excalibur calcium-binding domain-containing protein n=1 Tax=Leucobacter sp. NPDC058333 TaxID=3346450 RepID=UPI003655519D
MTHWISDTGATDEHTNTQVLAGAGVSGAAHNNSAPRKRSKWLSIGVPVICSLLAFGLGSAAGSSGSAGERSSLAASEEQLQSDLTAANVAVDEAETLTAEAEQEAEAARDKLAESTELASSLQAQVKAHETKVTELTSSNETLTAQVADLQAAPPAAQFAETAPQAETSAPAESAPQPQPGAYYQNCTAARNAGAAPLTSASPGYGPHLDRDGDGVACE